MIASMECIIFEKQIDTHAIASVTIPVTGEYKLETWKDGWVKRDLKAGDIIGGVKRVMSKGCPGYNEIKVSGEKK